eukprot:30931_1
MNIIVANGIQKSFQYVNIFSIMHWNCYKNKSLKLQPDTDTLTVRKKCKNQFSTYTKPPDIEFNMDEFECYALSRLKVLRWIETQTSIGKSISDTLHSVIQKNNLHIAMNDQVSHFSGRLCFCQTSERRRWFLKLETILFEARYKKASLEQVQFVHNEL